MKEKGDIPEKEEIDLEIDSELVSNEAKRKISALETLVKKGNTEGHIYLPHTGEGEDYHIKERNSHFFVEQGYVYWHGNDRDRWAFAEDISLLESHYD